jgi:hypothetical protein
MAQSAPLSPVDLRRALVRLFDEEELRTLCFDLGVDYDSLRGEGKAARSRELVAWAERRGFLEELETVLRRLRPNLDVIYSPQRVRELQDAILARSESGVRDDFIEFTQQIDAYLDAFNLLHLQLEEWKEVHNLLQDLQTTFAPCRSYIFTLGRLRSRGSTEQQRERALYEVEVEWRPCRRLLHRLRHLASTIDAIGAPYNPELDTGPVWYCSLTGVADRIDLALFEEEVGMLVEQLSIFGNQVDQSLYLADKELRDVVNQIHHLRRPGT